MYNPYQTIDEHNATLTHMQEHHERRIDANCVLCPQVQFGLTAHDLEMLGWERTRQGDWICDNHGEK